ncbi:MAG: hypothetical protein KatS3mg110_4288 [Pirellulaceae bacterium]|nr:MAG: hypothetical protein KatS3mg110_4288 [Pirellulaceae bacterium]
MTYTAPSSPGVTARVAQRRPLPGVPCEQQFLVIGQPCDNEFAAPLRWLEQRAIVSFCSNVAEAIQKAATSVVPVRAVFILCERPSCIPSKELETLYRHLPLTRVVLVLGVWCQGQTHRLMVKSGPVCWHWYEFVDRFELAWSGGTLASDVKWPPTATAADKWAAQQPKATTSTAPHGVVACTSLVVRTGDRTTFCAVADLLEPHGWNCLWWPPGQPPLWHRTTALIWDMIQGDSAEWRQLYATVHSLVALPVIVLVGFPRPEMISRITKFGHVQLLAKPFLADVLVRRLKELVVAGSSPIPAVDKS